MMTEGVQQVYEAPVQPQMQAQAQAQMQMADPAPQRPMPAAVIDTTDLRAFLMRHRPPVMRGREAAGEEELGG